MCRGARRDQPGPARARSQDAGATLDALADAPRRRAPPAVADDPAVPGDARLVAHARNRLEPFGGTAEAVGVVAARRRHDASAARRPGRRLRRRAAVALHRRQRRQRLDDARAGRGGRAASARRSATSTARPSPWRRSPTPSPATSGGPTSAARTGRTTRRSRRGCSRLLGQVDTVGAVRPARRWRRWRCGPAARHRRDDRRRAGRLSVGTGSPPTTLSRPCGWRRSWRCPTRTAVPDGADRDARRQRCSRPAGTRPDAADAAAAGRRRRCSPSARSGRSRRHEAKHPASRSPPPRSSPRPARAATTAPATTTTPTRARSTDRRRRHRRLHRRRHGRQQREDRPARGPRRRVQRVGRAPRSTAAASSCGRAAWRPASPPR